MNTAKDKKFLQKITPKEAKKKYQEMVERKRKLRKHLQNGGKLSELDQDEFKFVKPL